MRGELKVQSEPGKGSRFTFSLPLQIATYQDFLESRAIPLRSPTTALSNASWWWTTTSSTERSCPFFWSSAVTPSSRPKTATIAWRSCPGKKGPHRHGSGDAGHGRERNIPQDPGKRSPLRKRSHPHNRSHCPRPGISQGKRALSAGMDAYVVKPVDLEALHNLIMKLIQEPSKPHELESVPPPEQEPRPTWTCCGGSTMATSSCFGKSSRPSFPAQPPSSAISKWPWRRGDTAAVARSAHKMASAASAVKGQRLMRACRFLEEGALAGENWEDVTAKFERLKTLFRELENHIQASGLYQPGASEEP